MMLTVLAVVAAVAALLAYVPPVRFAALVAVGRSPVCPWDRALRAKWHVEENTRIKDRILSASRLVEKDGGFHLWETPKGRFWITAGSDYGLPWNLAEQELKIYGGPEQFVRPGEIVLDCGAHVGVFTKEALAAGAKLVVAIEPAPENLVCLRRNLGPEIAAGRVIIYPKGVWDKDDRLTLQVSPQNSAADTFVIHQQGAQPGAQVPLTTIDKLVQELRLERVDFIKMDIEGAEQRALIGARATIGRDHPRLSLASYHLPDDPVKIPALVRQAWEGYRMACGPCVEANGRIRPDVLYFF